MSPPISAETVHEAESEEEKMASAQDELQAKDEPDEEGTTGDKGTVEDLRTILAQGAALQRPFTTHVEAEAWVNAGPCGMWHGINKVFKSVGPVTP
jgi:hypothetical protein